jgi:hypothetical protein
MVLPALQPVEEGAVLTLAGMMHVLDSRVKCVRMIAHAWVSRGAIMHASHMLLIVVMERRPVRMLEIKD